MKKQKNQNSKAFKNYPLIVIIGLSLILIAGGVYDNFVRSKEGTTPDQQTQSNNTDKTSEKMDQSKTSPKTLPYRDPPPQVSAKAFAVVNLTDNIELYAQNPDLALPPASVTKLMTALVALETYDLDKPVAIPEKCTQLHGSRVGFQPNEAISLEDLLYGLLVESGADAACAIANIDNEHDFIQQMNNKSKELGMQNTNFTNEIGFDDSTYQISSVKDLVILSKEALKSGVIRKIVGTREVSVKSLNTARSYSIRSTNDLLFTIPGTTGIKTGSTPEAGECLLYLYENKDQEILIVILGSQNRFADTRKLLDWAQLQIALNNLTGS